MGDGASENIRGAISKLDASMSKMVEQDPENLQALYGAIRLQVENIEAKIHPFVKDKEELSEEQVEDHYFWGDIQEAENFYDDKKPLGASQLRKYIRLRLDAIYSVLKQKGIYELTVDYDTDDLDVVSPREMEKNQSKEGEAS